MIIRTSLKIVSCYSLCSKESNFYKAPIFSLHSTSNFHKSTETLEEISIVEGADSKRNKSFKLS